MAQPIQQLPYFPNRNQYEAQTSEYLQKQPMEALPRGFPKKLVSEMAWEREDISLDHTTDRETPYLVILQDSHLVEIDAALRHFQALNQPLEALNSLTFPLPSLHSILRSTSDNLHSGYGFALVRGVPVERYTSKENMIIYLGISSHIAPIRGRQDHQFKGQPADVMVAHITDMRRPGEAQDFALPAYSDGEVIFHTDSGDIVSLFVLSEPLRGGDSLLASGWTVYNALAETRPDLIRALAEDWPIPSAQQPGLVNNRPLLFHQPASETAPERVILQFSRRSFSGFGARSQMSTMLTPTQVEALNALHFLAEKYHVTMELKRGDMQFLNNLSMLHARKSYEDDTKNRRHLLRLWLRDPQNSWVTPEPLRNRSDRIFSEGFESGLQMFPVDPTPRSVGRAPIP
ncbi:hypothetical protein BDW59DRAFT_152907 [Aspergillus cavernicola]|uniref:TauD/TfdA-like domain-containing protein n=1 Tax=Aspergillus cavernicola TaxID=176166 RepID=A0ABR4HNP8_9EURO